ncbi:MAG: N-6 DNA methylase [Bacteroidales bacterium]|nr:N-6 DNA methylase [Bacteroidales bacterium]
MKDSDLKTIGFKLSKSSNSIYEKSYPDGTIIRVDFAKEHISYGKIRIDRNTITNFDKEENFVVLECVDRLLRLGYLGENLYLEKNCGDEKDWLDIVIYRKDYPSRIFSIIECKTYGEKYEQAIAETKRNGRQILRYAIQDKYCQSIMIYASRFTDKEVEREHGLIDLTIYDAANRDELLALWNKEFIQSDFFDTSAYSGVNERIKRKDLQKLTVQDIGGSKNKRNLYNEFKEILRVHSVSDKDNAYNKIFNLFLCKIVDEDGKTDDEYTDFQWGKDEDAETVLLRLNDLYKEGMKSKLDLSITDYTENDIVNAIERDIPIELKKIFTELRLYKNNEFAFKEVFDKRTFYENAAVVRAVVKLLERKLIKNTNKQQFLGDFFEKLLNIGVKQEAGQFFTPIPIAEFILKSIPIEDIITEKIKRREDDFLPYIVDYSCGSGHFLTEAMNRVQEIIDNPEFKSTKLTNAQKNKLSSWQNFNWAKEFVYGIEDDYRLAKTTKVACFMNGDGEANIIYANGLDSFNSVNYKGRLLSSGTDNEKFDVVVANPPYSVDDFKNRLKNGDNDFSLYKSTKKDKIECLFVERTGQLLCDDGVAGIILPSTFLITDDYIETRRYLLSNFLIMGICFLGQQTFAATQKSTCVLFLKKISSSKKQEIQQYIENLTKDFSDFSYNGQDNIIAQYVKSQLDCSVNDYLSEMAKKKEAKLKVEKQKLFAWLLNYNRSIPIIYPGEKEEESRFLGYKHTAKRNYEGIAPYPSGMKKIDSMLYGDNLSDDRVCYYIQRSFKGETNLRVNSVLKDHIKYRRLSDCMLLGDDSFIILTKEFKKIISPLNQTPLSDETICVDITSGDSAPQGRYLNKEKKGTPFIRAGHIKKQDDNHYVIPQEYVSDEYAQQHKMTLFDAGSVVFPKSGQSINTNNIALLKEPSYVVSHLAVLTFKTPAIGEYVYYILRHYETSNFKLDDYADYPTLKLGIIKKFLIPYEKTIADKFIEQINKIQRDGRSIKSIRADEDKLLNELILKK